MGYVSKVQVIRRGSNDQKQYYLICPAYSDEVGHAL
jgi:hypothetical protein